MLGFIIAGSVIIILSYLFNILSKKTNIPTVILLIILGLLIKQGLHYFGAEQVNLDSELQILGVLGLIMIVLEAALDLKLKKEKTGLILKAFIISIILLLTSSFGISIIFRMFLSMDFYNSFLYAVPLAIMSSAIIIPSVSHLIEEKKEFMIYESTFSDILGIMLFYFLVDLHGTDHVGEITANVLQTIAITIIISFAASYIMLWVFQNVKTHTKLFLMVAILLLLYAIGKLLHLSSLIIILVFGLMLSNQRIFFRGFLKKKLFKLDVLKEIYNDFNTITVETAFVVRTFFFVIFGMTIILSTLLDFKVFLITLGILAVLYGFRFIVLRLFFKSEIFPELFIAPRGLITILLFFAIPSEFQVVAFNSGILLFTILASSIIMMIGLIKNSKKTIKIEPVRLDIEGEVTHNPEDKNADFSI